MRTVKSVWGVRMMKSELEDTIEKFLRSRGWKYSCSFPDSCWRWGKKVYGKMVWVSRKDALSIEEYL